MCSERNNGKAITVGRKNIETALRILRNRNLDLTGFDVGGTMGRKIHFYTHTGQVWLKRIKRREHV